MSDPVAQKSGFLKTYMSNHPDTLVAYAKYFGKVTDSISSAEMTAIDSNSMTLTYTVKNTKQKKVIQQVPLDPPLAGYEEVKPRLLGMKAEAQEGLGMIKAPQITDFRLPANSAITCVVYAILLYITFPDISPSPLFTPARTIHACLGGLSTLKLIWQVTAVVHILESLYTLSLCKRHRTGFVVGTVYFLNTVIFGFPIWTDLRRRIQDARIESVMKVE
ncbi:hypothetical protein PILCRDRAFT_61272 [Piloderma croceum F 1598]|uniref:DUF2470 domain-containing protein n=1 Tax=Piloderma croceum (strain F 1598) TaxID=765440 RepID=A0A0C3BS20_PILCF|nr:hypothetical protein PILCRDRAFT_61272 [Piloderma croceum F 1598]